MLKRNNSIFKKVQLHLASVSVHCRKKYNPRIVDHTKQ